MSFPLYIKPTKNRAYSVTPCFSLSKEHNLINQVKGSKLKLSRRDLKKLDYKQKLVLNHDLKREDLFKWLNLFSYSLLESDIKTDIVKYPCLEPVNLVLRRVLTFDENSFKLVSDGFVEDNKSCLFVVFNDRREICSVLNESSFLDNCHKVTGISSKSLRGIVNKEFSSFFGVNIL